MAVNREEKVEFAKVAELAERYDDMLKAMNEVAQLPGDLSVEERNLLSVAYKNVVGSRRFSWRFASEAEQKEGDENPLALQACKLLQEQIEKEIEELCNKAFEVLDKHRIPEAKTPESQVFFNKMKGDYKRYMAEVATGENRNKAADDSLIAYKAALAIAEEHLPAENPIRLGLALNFSVFYYEILSSKSSACRLATSALESLKKENKDLSDDTLKESSLITRLLQDNLTLWNSDPQGDDDAETGQPATVAGP